MTAVSTQYERLPEVTSHNANDAVIGLRYRAEADVLITVYAWGFGNLNSPGAQINAGIQCVISIPAIGDDAAQQVIDDSFNYPSSTVSFWSACSTAIRLRKGQEVPITLSCKGYGQQSNQLAVKTINGIVVIQSMQPAVLATRF